jgi:hypothetical protein
MKKGSKMPWKKLTYFGAFASNEDRSYRENYIQRIFNNWASDKPIMAGAPPWLFLMKSKNERAKSRVPGGWPFTPDVVWHDGKLTYIVELKFGKKYEPLALAQVCYEAWAHEKSGDKRLSKVARASARIRPVVVAQYNPWLRGACAYLLASGLRPDAIGYLELDLLFGSESTPILWFDAPLAPLEKRNLSLPPEIVGSIVIGGGARLVKVADVDTWIATTELVEGGSRPVLWTKKYAMLSRIQTQQQNQQGWVLWRGQPGEAGRFHRYRAGKRERVVTIP